MLSRLPVALTVPRRGACCFIWRHTVATMLLAMVIAPAARAVCYVDDAASAGGNGSSWQSAYSSLQSALQNSACTEIWVKAGRYTPSASDASASFAVLPGRQVYGGFAGTESSRGQRDPIAHVTILSGDLDGNDSTASGGIDASPPSDSSGWDNSRHVVTVDGTTTPITASTVLDGFTITAGIAASLSLDYYGGGLLCNGSGSGHACSPTLANLSFSGNQAGLGGALCDYGYQGASSPALTNVNFTGNVAVSNGGAIYNDGSEGGVSSPVLTNGRFEANRSTYGGAMFNDGGDGGTSSPLLTHVVFTGNSSSNGGAIFNSGRNQGVSSPALTDVSFTGNNVTADEDGEGYGGAMYDNGDAEGDSSPLLSNVSFIGNSAENGGAIYNSGQPDNLTVLQGKSDPTLIDVTFSDNSAGENGGAIYNGGGLESENNPTLTNVTFSGNQAGTWGGAIYNDANGLGILSSPVLINVTFSGNSAVEGGAIFNYATGEESQPLLTNVILWSDSASLDGPEIYNYEHYVTIDHSIVQGSGGSASWNASLGIDGGGNIDADPLLGALTDNGGYTQTMLPAESSAAIDAGDNALCPVADQRGVPHSDGYCDIGAVERQGDLIFVGGFDPL